MRHRLFATCHRRFHTIQNDRHTWSVLKHVYQKQLKTSGKKYACLLLNITDSSQEFLARYNHFWADSDLKVAVDGSANYLEKRRALHTADVISGDFDSIDEGLIERLQSPKESSEDNNRLPLIIETQDQKETDFTKAMRVINKLRPDIQHFFALYHSDGSRIDHIFGMFNTLHILKGNIFTLNIVSGTMSWLLQPGGHTILKPQGQELCSVIPLTGTTEVRTQGLRYNINSGNPLSFGGLISTSNSCQEHKEKITIDTNREVLWSIDLQIERQLDRRSN